MTKKLLFLVLLLVFSLPSVMAADLPYKLVFPEIESIMTNNTDLDLEKIVIRIDYQGDHIDPITKVVNVDPVTAKYHIPSVTIPFGPVDYIEGNYFHFTVTAIYNGKPILRMSDINVWTWEDRSYSLSEFLAMYKNGLSTLSLELYDKQGPNFNQPYITGDISQ